MICGMGLQFCFLGPLRSYLALDGDLNPHPMTPLSEAPSHLSSCFRAIVILPGDRHKAMGPRAQAPRVPESFQEGPVLHPNIWVLVKGSCLGDRLNGPEQKLLRSKRG